MRFGDGHEAIVHWKKNRKVEIAGIDGRAKLRAERPRAEWQK